MQTRMAVVELSRGSLWAPGPADPPYLLADHDTVWPENATAYIVFTNTAGSELATLEAETVTPEFIGFHADPAEVDAIPAGANFEIFLDTLDAPVKLRYGKVIRREVTFTDAPANQLSNIALKFADTFPTLGLRSNWKTVLGRPKVYDHPGTTPNGVGPNNILFTTTAIRWDTPLNGDTVQVRVQLLNPGAGKTGIVVCADQRFTSGLVVMFESGLANNKLHLCTMSGPVALTDLTAPITHTVTDLAEYLIGYSELTKTLTVHATTDLSTPLASWTDDTGAVPHGPGYRYLGANWQASLLSTGIQICGWLAKDN